jgi:hypothetical protein
MRLRSVLLGGDYIERVKPELPSFFDLVIRRLYFYNPHPLTLSAPQIIFKSSSIPECEATREYCDDYLKDTKVRDIIDRRGSTDDVDKLREKMESFSITAYDEKRKWIDTSTESKKWTVTGKDIGIWLDKLQKIRVEVRILTSKIRRNLECPTSSGRFSIEACKE